MGFIHVLLGDSSKVALFIETLKKVSKSTEYIFHEFLVCRLLLIFSREIVGGLGHDKLE